MSDAAGCMKLIIAGFNAELFISNPSPACIMVCSLSTGGADPGGVNISDEYSHACLISEPRTEGKNFRDATSV